MKHNAAAAREVVTLRECDICRRNGADHEKPNGGWIHLSCGQRIWNRQVRLVNEKLRKKDRS